MSKDYCQRLIKVAVVGDARESIERGISLIGDLGQAIGKGDNVFVKPNLNSWDHYRGSTDLAFLRAVVGLLLGAGAKVMIGDCSGRIWRLTRNVFQKLGVFE